MYLGDTLTVGSVPIMLLTVGCRRRKLLAVLLAVAVATLDVGQGSSQIEVIVRGDGTNTQEDSGGEAATQIAVSEGQKDASVSSTADATEADLGSGVTSQPASCPNPPTVSGAHIQLAVERVPSGVLLRVTYTCIANRILIGASVLACGPHNGFSWRQQDVPSCVEDTPPRDAQTTHSPTTPSSAPITSSSLTIPPDVSCGPSLAVHHAVVTNNTETQAWYRCAEGYKQATRNRSSQDTTMHVVCNRTTGQWARPSWDCFQVDCGPPPLLAHTVRRFQRTTINSGALYLCATGALPMTGVRFSAVSCLPSGRWSTSNIECEYIDCGTPLSFPGVNISFSTSHYGSTASMQCLPGYELHQDSLSELLQANSGTLDMESLMSMTCQRNASWTGLQVHCVPTNCRTPPSLEDGTFSVRLPSVEDNETVFSFAEYACNIGYLPSGNTRRVCHWNNTWSNSDMSCIQEAVECPPPPFIPAAMYERMAPEGGLPESVFYSCTTGNVGTGIAMATCTLGAWSELTLECNPLSCGQPQRLPLTEVYYINTEYDSHATYQCQNGYRGEEQVWVCGVNGQWSGTQPSCEVAGCDAPLPVLNSYVQVSTGNTTSDFQLTLLMDLTRNYPVGTSLRYRCTVGLMLLGGAVRTCQESQAWDGFQPRCLRLTCPSLPTVAHGDVDVTGYEIGATATFSCDDRYVLDGSERLTCGAGMWSGTAPTCVYADPEIITEAAMDRGQRRTRNGTLHAYVGSQKAYLRCISTKGQQPITLRWTRLSGQKALHARIRHQQTKEGRPSLRAIFKPVQLLHAGIWRCLANNSHGETHRDVQLYVYVPCPQPPSVSSGQVVSVMNTAHRPEGADLSANRSQYYFNEQVSYHCYVGHVLIGTKVRTCQADGTWSGASSACYRRNCGTPAVPQNGRVVGSQYRFGDSVIYHCNRGYRLLGSHVRRCQTTGQWSRNAPSCRSVDCGPPSLLPYTNMQGRRFVFGSVITVTCRDGYFDQTQLSSSGSLRCHEDGTWRGLQPNCTLIQCLAPPAPRNALMLHPRRRGQLTQRLVIPGTVFIHNGCVEYTCEEGHTRQGAATRCCNNRAQWSNPPPTCQGWCQSVTCGTGEKCVSDLQHRRARCQCLTEADDCRFRSIRHVCGNDGSTYASRCSLDAMACRTANSSLAVQHNRPCSPGYNRCQCRLSSRSPVLTDCFASRWSMLVRVVSVHEYHYYVHAFKVFQMGEKPLVAGEMYKLTRVPFGECVCPELQSGYTYLVSGLEGHSPDVWTLRLIVTSLSYARQHVYPQDVLTLQWPCG